MTMNRDHNDTLKLKDYKDTRILQMSWSIDYISYSLVVAEQLQKALWTSKHIGLSFDGAYEWYVCIVF